MRFFHLGAGVLAGWLWLALLPAQADGVLRFVPHADLKVLDPIWTTGYITRNHGYMVYDTLFAFDSSFTPRPQMVDRWTVSPDGLIYQFTLRPGLKFHDLSPVRAADCVASIARWAKRDAMGQTLMSFVAALRVVDDGNFVIELKEPYAFVLDSLAKLSSSPLFIMREKEALTDPFQQITEVIGSGPFKFVKAEWVPGNKVVYEKFADYIPRDEPPDMAAGGKRVKVDRVEWIYLPDGTTAVNALTKGEVDWVEAPVGDLVPVLARSRDVRVEVLDKLGSVGDLRPNHLLPPFNNVKARQALLYMVDQGDYMSAVMGDAKYWRKCPSYFPCGTPLEVDAPDGLMTVSHLDRARALLKESGYKGEPITVLDPTDSPYAHQQALVTAEGLRSIGATVDLRAVDWSTMLGIRAKKEPPSQGGWNIFHTWTVAPDLITPLQNNALRMSGDKAWFGWPDDPELERIYDRWTRSRDDAEKKQLALELQNRALEVVPYVPTGQFVTPTAFRANLQGMISAPVTFLWNVEKTGP